MKGLELARQYYEVCGAPAIAEKFPECWTRISVGLVGAGSECFGYDDEISTDHDYGPGFCLWLTKEDHQTIGLALQRVYDELPGSFLGIPPRAESPYAGRRVGVFSIPEFYGMFLGRYQPPTDHEWFRIPEENLAAAVNGAVFRDEMGAFTAVREGLLSYYPRDVWLKKISARLCVMAQSGQYNYERCLRRGDVVAARLALGEFLRAAISLAHLLCRRYMPFYKWAFRRMEELPLPGALTVRLKELAAAEIRGGAPDGNVQKIEEICEMFVRELRKLGLSGSTSDFLLEHGTAVAEQIIDPVIRGMSIMEG